MRHLLLLIALGCAGCLRQTEFKCAMDADCTGTGGTCQSTGYCSFTDTDCAAGQRYGDYAGTFSNKCVGDVPMDDAGVDGSTVDMAQGNCPATYMALPNAGAHLYKLTNNASQWSTQRDRCAADGANVYLAVPDDAAELAAIVTKGAAQRVWVGINDIMTEGTYLTVKGAAATFLPWDTNNNEPDNPGGNGGEDCVSGLMASPNIATDRCGTTFPAVCECEP